MQTRVIQVDPKTLKLLEVNARFMRHEEFQRQCQEGRTAHLCPVCGKKR